MKIIVLNGSPKGDLSITMQYFKYVKKNFPDHDFKTINIAKEINKIENSPEYFLSIIEEIKSSDGIMWGTPVYTLLIPSQLKRFIELIFENNSQAAFNGKYATALTTSVRFFDHCAHNYINAICDDLKMCYIDGFSAKKDELLEQEVRDNLINFAENFFDSIERNLPVEIKYTPISYTIPEYTPNDIPDIPKTGNKKIVVISDAGENDTNLNRMISVFKKCIPNKVEIINLNEINIKSGCTGCIMCAYERTCIYNDDFISIYKEKILPADAIIFAGKIRDRYLSSKWKMFFDRSFFNGHSPVLKGKQIGYIISGPLKQIPNLRQVLEAYGETQKTNIIGFITDEYNNPGYLTGLIKNFAYQIEWAVDKKFQKPATFLGKGGHAIFRDFVYSMKHVFRADHIFYKKHQLYDFPQKEIKHRLTISLLMLLFKIPKIRKQMQKDIRQHMIKQLQELFED